MTDPVHVGRERLPIKLIMPRQGRERPNPTGGPAPNPFVPVDNAFRQSLSAQIAAIRDSLTPQLENVGAAPVRVQLISRALAKSHRPQRLFSEDTCPIIGAGALGELYVKATPVGLDTLLGQVQHGASKQIVKDLSTVESIAPVTPLDRRKRKTAREVLQNSPRRGQNAFLTRVRLFDFGSPRQQARAITAFKELCAQRDIGVFEAGYSPHNHVYGVACHSEADVEQLSKFVGVRSIIGMPVLRAIRAVAFNDRALPNDLPLASDVEGDFPSVVVVDSGVDPNIISLNSWVVGRSSTVSEPYRNTAHGTFVGGLIVWGDRLNPQLPDIDNGPCGIFDLQVIPNADPGAGDTENITEQEFLQTLETSLKDHANRYKVWNLSLSTSEVCAEDEFSAFAEELDDLQERFQVSLVVAAGNYETPPLLDYPRSAAQIPAGRITAPADCVLGITVGAISHVDYQARGPKQGEPSPFSRHGAGPNYIIKPDHVHFGGTCTTDVQHVAGVRSVCANGSAEDIGTSFATPLVSRTLAQIYHQITPTPSPVLARALLTHHARDPRTGDRVPAGDEDFLGFGRPVPPPYCLACAPHQSTLIFEDQLRPGFFLEWADFPYPPSLFRDGKFFGQVFMTIAFAPARGGRWGTEYCETHIDAHFGVYRTRKSRPDPDTGKRKISEEFVGLVPPEHANPERLYEDVQVRELRKWAPVRTYHGDLSAGERGNRWRLMVRLLTRHGVEDYEAQQSQPFALIVTIADPERKAPVYDEMAQLIHNRYQSKNLDIRAAARIRSRQ